MNEKEFLGFLDKKLDEILRICSEIKGNRSSEKIIQSIKKNVKEEK